jgi:putative transposase
MGIKRHKRNKILTKLRPVKVLISQGMERIDAIRQICITKHNYDRRRKPYGGVGPVQLTELKRLQKENELLSGAVYYTRNEAQIIIEICRKHHNTKRPQSELGDRPLAPEDIVAMDQRPSMTYRSNWITQVGWLIDRWN